MCDEASPAARGACLDKDGPFFGLDKVANAKLQGLWFDEQAELEFMQIVLIAYGPVLRLGYDAFRSKESSKK